jgi:hypothetical protein
MPNYLLEAFLPRAGAGDARAQESAARSAAETLTRGGTPVGFTGSIYVPEDEMGLFSFDAPSISAVERAAEQAGLRVLRVVEAIPSSTVTNTRLDR